ncbi:MAG TPA: prepilin-type N-terminal cleavage/methylation domain-containing protein [Planctomycetaceae bacterium]|nr:prepilin-type N-terminal cleavage/methylation domain-containing protein [Planctomycetaceae bacterium]
MRRNCPSIRSGFTLVEMLAVVVIIGILAAVIIPKFGNSKSKATFAAVKSDLHNLTTMEEAFFYDYQRYTSDLDSLKFTVSHGVVLTIGESTLSGWSATAYHPDSWPHMCAIFFGSAAPVTPATSAGTVACN